MTVKLLTEQFLEFLSLKGGCTGSCETIHVKMPHDVAQMYMMVQTLNLSYRPTGLEAKYAC